MTTKLVALTAVLLFAPTFTSAQPLRVYSEFVSINAKGEVAAPAEPREILSPALARNAYASFQIVVDAPEDTPWELYIAQNPENAVRAEVYRENGDRLEHVADPVSGAGVQVFWMDLWTDRNADVRRIKVEPQLHLNNDWVIYPMEGRVVNAVVPDAPGGKWPAGTASPGEVMRGLVCGSSESTATTNVKGSAAGAAAMTIPALRFRNAQQDRALAGQAPLATVREKFGPCEAAASNDPEAYYSVRDYLFRLP